MEPIKVFIGSDIHNIKAERALVHSLRRNASCPIDVVLMQAGGADPQWRGWNTKGWMTSFSAFRWAIPQLCKFQGKAVYLDVDMLVLGDVADLVRFPDNPGILSLPKEPSVLVFDCHKFDNLKGWLSLDLLKRNAVQTRHVFDFLKSKGMVGALDHHWNCLDGKSWQPDHTKLIHFTHQETQPWHPKPHKMSYKTHPDASLARLWLEYYEESFLPEQHWQMRRRYASYANRHSQPIYIVGKGPTKFDYGRLAEAAEPVLFINESISLAEKHRPNRRQSNFLFAHDRALSRFICDSPHYTCVLPEDKGGDRFDDSFVDSDGIPAVAYALFYRTKIDSESHDLERALGIDHKPKDPGNLPEWRNLLRRTRWLTTYNGTIISAITFAWYLGATELRFIGCDGLNDPRRVQESGGLDGYDARLADQIVTTPWWQYSDIRRASEELLRRLQLPYVYLGTPA